MYPKDNVSEETQPRRPAKSDFPTTAAPKALSLALRSNGLTLEFDMLLDITQFSQNAMWNLLSAGELYEPETSHFIACTLQDGDTFIDVGSHVGYFALLASRLVRENGLVLAFEPEQTNFSALRNHIEQNRASNIHPFQLALGARNTEAPFYVNVDNDGGHAFWDISLHPFNKKSRTTSLKRRIKVATLDSLLEERDVGPIKAIKIDAEGSECEILRGAQQTIRKHRIPFICCEVNRFALEQMGANEDKLRSFLESMGYHTHLLIFDRGSTKALRLQPNQSLKTEYVFNLLFTHRETKLPPDSSIQFLQQNGFHLIPSSGPRSP